MNNQNESLVKQGIERYSDIKALMFDITIHHPQLIGYMMNPNDSKTCIDEVCKNIFYQQGGANKNNMDTVQKIRTMFDLFKSIDCAKTEIRK